MRGYILGTAAHTSPLIAYAWQLLIASIFPLSRIPVMAAAAQAIDVVPRNYTGYNHGGEGDTPIASLSRSRPNYGSLTNVNVNGCFESDRVIKSGYVEKRTKTKVRDDNLS